MIFLVHRLSGSLVTLIIAALFLSAATAANPPLRASAQTECASAMDLMLVLDGSESIGWTQFDTLQTFASDLVGQLSISSADAHVGIVQFSGEGQGRVEIGLSDDAGAVQAAVSAMEQIVGVTDIQEGIAFGQGQLTAAGRPDVPHVIVLVTDGEHNQPGDPVLEGVSARSLGTQIFAIAVGSEPNIAQLKAIVSAPAGDHVFSVDDFDGLMTILEPVVQVVCPPTPTGTASATETRPGDATPAATPRGDATPPASSTESPPSDEFDGEPGEVLGVTQLPAVGGISVDPELGVLPLEKPGSSAGRAGVLAGIAAGVAAGALALSGAAWYARRRWLS